MEGKTQQQQCGLELQLMNSNNFCCPQNSWRGQWNHKLHGAHPFLNAAFLSQKQTALLLTKVIFILVFTIKKGKRKKIQPNNNKTPANPDQENQEPLKACASISKPMSACPQRGNTRRKEAFRGQILLSFALAEMMPLKLRELLAGWPAQWTSGRIQVSLTWSEQRSLSQALRHTNWLFNHIEQNRLPYHFSPSWDLIRDIK